MERFLEDLRTQINRSKTWMVDPDIEPDTQLYHEGKIEAYTLALKFLEKRSAVRGPAIKMISDAMKILDEDHAAEEAFARYEKKFAEFEDELADKEDEISAMQVNFLHKSMCLNNDIDDASEMIAARNDRIEFLESELAKRDSKIEGLLENGDRDYHLIQKLMGERDGLECEIEEKEETESALRAELDKADDLLVVKEKSIQHLYQIVDYLDKQYRTVGETQPQPKAEVVKWWLGETEPSPKKEKILDFTDDEPESEEHRGVWKSFGIPYKLNHRQFKFCTRR